MRGYIGRHPHGYTGSPVDQQVRNLCGQDERLHHGSVIVRCKFYRLLIEIRQHLSCDLCHSDLGISHGCRRISIYRTKVPLAVYNRVSHGKVLRKTYNGIIHGNISVRVVLTDDISDDSCRLLIRSVPGDTHFIHGVKDAPVNRL